MLAYIKRNRRRLLGAAAIAGAGAAGAYYLFNWWLPSRQEETLQRLDDQGSGASIQSETDADAHLEQHFQSIQNISDGTTLPQMLPLLEERLGRAADVAGLTERLKRGRSGSSGEVLTAAEKVRWWGELTVESFARTAAAAWLLALLDLTLRVQLNILGRHLYLQNAADARVTPRARDMLYRSRSGRTLPRLTAHAQELFLNYANFLPEVGLAGVVSRARDAAARVVADVQLNDPVGGPELQTMLSSIHAGIEAELGPEQWAGMILPCEQESSMAIQAATRPDYTALTTNADNDVDEEMVASMVAEMRRVLACPEFAMAVRVAVRATAKRAAEVTAEQLPAPLPLARVVPLVAAGTQAVLAPAGDFPRLIAELEPVERLCALVYACEAG